MGKNLFDTVQKNNLYWLFQIGGWLLFFIIYNTRAYFDNQYNYTMGIVFANMVLFGFLITHQFRLYIKRKQWYKLSLPKLSFNTFISSILLGIAWSVVTLPIILLLADQTDITANLILGYTFNLILILLIWSILYFFFQLFFTYKKSEIEKYQLDVEVKDSQLLALKSQINPHFIFNSLNNIRGLIHENPDNAALMITNLSVLLRYSIRLTNLETVSLKEELDIVRKYLELESVQFEDRLKYALEVDDALNDVQIPPMSIQLLTENGIKHGISNLVEGGEIIIRCFEQDSKLFVEVINSGQLKVSDSPSGIGLENATKRLKLLYGEIHSFKLENLNDTQVIACFSLPIKRKHESHNH